MIFEKMQNTQSIHSIVKELATRTLDSVSLTTVLLETVEDERVYYSLAVALLPCPNPQEDICIVHDITGDRTEADRIFWLISDGLVTPCTLEDVLSDML